MVGVSSTTGAVAGTNSNSRADQSRMSLGTDFGNFLKLLTVQLKNQDPTAPLEPNEFTQQIVSFSAVEQSINTNKNLERLISVSQTQQLNSAVGYIGKEVEIDASKATLTDAGAQFSYSLANGAAQTQISIADSSGKVIFNSTGEVTAGKHVFQWDGKDNIGNGMPDGSYQIIVSSVDRNGNSVDATTSVVDKVTGIEMQNGNLMVTMGDNLYSVDRVMSVRESAAKSTNSNGT
jgi:flagellar basal-body rod modification protein FlgD